MPSRWPYTKSCVGMLTGAATVLSDGVPGSGLPVFGVVLAWVFLDERC